MWDLQCLDDEMLKTKKFRDFLEPLDKRVKAVEKFLKIFKRSLVCEVTKLSFSDLRLRWRIREYRWDISCNELSHNP